MKIYLDMCCLQRPMDDQAHLRIHLEQEMGASDTIRFLNQFSTGTGNYTKERAAYFDHLTLDEVFGEIKATDPEKNESS